MLAFAVASAWAPPRPRRLRELFCVGADDQWSHAFSFFFTQLYHKNSYLSNRFRYFFGRKKFSTPLFLLCAKLWKTLWIMRKTCIFTPFFAIFLQFMQKHCGKPLHKVPFLLLSFFLSFYNFYKTIDFL